MATAADTDLTTESVRALLDYDPGTGMFTWRIRRGNARFNARFAGKEAGCIHTNAKGAQYRLIGVNGRLYWAHRLVFIWMGEPLPEQVDHLDHNGLNNAWHNVVGSCPQKNAKNSSKPVTNKSGVTGVSWASYTNRWRVQVQSNGVAHFLGYFNEEDLDLAAMEVMEFRVDNGFSPTHGLELAPYHRRDY